MKNVIFFFACLLFLSVATAQTKESVYAAMSADLCKEIKTKQAELKASDNIQMDLGLLMMPIFMKYETDLKKAVPSFDIADEKQVEALGMEVGKKLISCPEFLTLVSANKDLVKVESADRVSVS